MFYLVYGKKISLDKLTLENLCVSAVSMFLVVTCTWIMLVDAINISTGNKYEQMFIYKFMRILVREVMY